MKWKLFTNAMLLSVCFLAACEHGNLNKTDDIDPSNNLTRDDYRGMFDERQYQARPEDSQITPIPDLHEPKIDFKVGNVAAPKIPDLAEIIAAPRAPKIGQTKLVSVAVTDDVPLKDVLIELSRLADVDIEVDSGISGGISFRAKDRPFNEVVDRIASMAGLRYSMANNVLRIERDVPFVQTYALDMLNIDRSSSGSFGGGGGAAASSGSSSGSSGESSGGGSSATSGSTSSITSDSKGEFWDKFKESLDRIIISQGSNISSSQAPVAAQPAAAGATTTAAGGSFYSLNRQAGVLTVSGTQRQHEVIQEFLNAIQTSVSGQVLIEAKIVEVSLSDRYQSGINWAEFGGDSISFQGDFDVVTPLAESTGAGPATISVLKNDIFRRGLNLDAAVKLLNEFGTTRALSSPRLNAINNQQAILSFVENLVYFDVKIEVTDAVAATSTAAAIPAKVEVTSEKLQTPVGITLAILPSINQKTDEITLSVRPVLTKVTRFVDDPGFEFAKASISTDIVTPEARASLLAIKSSVPQIEVREMDSILKVKSGQVMVIGGLLEDRVMNNDIGIPGASEVPFLGNLFKSVTKSNQKSELIIFLRATSVPTTGNVQPADKAVYEKFTTDPRPLNF